MPQLIVVFGGSGFIGRHVVAKLAKTGARIRVAVRHPNLASRVFPMGDPGQIAAVRCDVTDEAQVAAAVAGADVVVNLVGILAEWGARSFDAVQAEGAGIVARAAHAAGATSFVHVSAIGADPQSESGYARTKAEGEAQVLEQFPDALILRPSIVFGPEDGFFNRFGSMATWSPVLPVFGGGETKMQPVFVGDVAEALTRGLARGERGVFELGGARAYTFRELMDYVRHVTGLRPFLLPLPWWLGSVMGAILEWLPGQMLTRDQVALLRRDNVVSPGARGLKELGIAPVPVEAVVPSYLYMFRKAGQFTDLRQR
jgi:NADH dehydrogenase